MRFQPNIKECRQAAYQYRARRAFFMAKLMAPAVALGISAAAWSDPVLGPRLETGLEEVKPLVQAVRDGAPVMEVLAGATAQAGLAARASREADAADAIPPEQPEVRSSMAVDLPTSNLPVNRPGSPYPSGD